MTMSFKEAMRVAAAFQRVRRPHWPTDHFVVYVPAMVKMPDGPIWYWDDGTMHPYEGNPEDDAATDWDTISRMHIDHPDFTGALGSAAVLPDEPPASGPEPEERTSSSD